MRNTVALFLLAVSLLVPCAVASGQTLDAIGARLEEVFASGELLDAAEAMSLGQAALAQSDASTDLAGQFNALGMLLDVASLSPDESDRALRDDFSTRAAALLGNGADSDAVAEFLLGQTVRPRVWMPTAKRADWSSQFRAWTQGNIALAENDDVRDLLQRIAVEQRLAIIRDTALGVLSDAEKADLKADLRVLPGEDSATVAQTIDEIERLSAGTVLTLQVENLEGDAVRLEDLRGRIVLQSGWATWCAPCLAIFPQENELAEALADAPFTMLGVNDDADRAKAVALAQQAGLNFRSIWSPSATPSVIDQLGMSGLPAFIILAADGRIITRARGGDEWTVRYVHDAARTAARDLQSRQSEGAR